MKASPLLSPVEAHEKDNRTPEQEELIRLRKENQQLRMENDILKQAALILGCLLYTSRCV